MTVTFGFWQHIICNDLTFWSDLPVPSLYSSVGTHLLKSSGNLTSSGRSEGLLRNYGRDIFKLSQNFLNHKRRPADSYHRSSLRAPISVSHYIIPSTLKAISGCFLSWHFICQIMLCFSNGGDTMWTARENGRAPKY